MKKKFTVVAIIGLLFFIFWFKKFGPPATADLQETIRIGIIANFPPFSFINDENKIAGFEIDLSKEIANLLGKKLLMVNMDIDTLLYELENGYLMAAAGIAPTAKRQKEMLFTQPYLTGNALYILTNEQNKIASIKDLEKKNVVVLSDSLAEDYVSKLPNIKFESVKSITEAQRLLKENKTFAIIASNANIKHFIDNSNNYNKLIIEETDENFSFAIPKEFPELLSQFNKALDHLDKNGTLKLLREKWKAF